MTENFRKKGEVGLDSTDHEFHKIFREFDANPDHTVQTNSPDEQKNISEHIEKKREVLDEIALRQDQNEKYAEMLENILKHVERLLKDKSLAEDDKISKLLGIVNDFVTSNMIRNFIRDAKESKWGILQEGTSEIRELKATLEKAILKYYGKFGRLSSRSADNAVSERRAGEYIEPSDAELNQIMSEQKLFVELGEKNTPKLVEDVTKLLEEKGEIINDTHLSELPGIVSKYFSSQNFEFACNGELITITGKDIIKFFTALAEVYKARRGDLFANRLHLYVRAYLQHEKNRESWESR